MTSLERAWRGGRNDWRLHLLSIFSVAVAFVCLAAALLVVVNMNSVHERWADSGRASVFFKSNATHDQMAAIESALHQANGVQRVRFVSSEDARRQLLGTTDDPVLGALPVNAFPASLEVTLDHAAAGRLDELTAQLEKLPAVDGVQTYQNWSARLGSLLSGGVWAALLLALVVLGAVVSVVSSTIRLTLERRRIEVEVLKLVGATDGYVRRPFVLEGAAQGAIGAAAAVMLLGVLYAVVRSHFDGQLALLIGVSPTFLPWSVSALMVLMGAMLGAAAAYGSLRKLLSV
jgi:cell division transport system permease protein